MAVRLRRMARSVRIEYAGAVYHVMCRGDRREAIYRDDEDRELSVTTAIGSIFKDLSRYSSFSAAMREKHRNS